MVSGTRSLAAGIGLPKYAPNRLPPHDVFHTLEDEPFTADIRPFIVVNAVYGIQAVFT